MHGYVLRTKEPLLVNADLQPWRAAHGVESIIVGEEAKSVLFAPLIVGDKARGAISLQNLDREHAFSDSDVRLLTTLAGSLSVALENARLFDQTKRLLTEADQRAAELAVVNSVQRGLAAPLIVGDEARGAISLQNVDREHAFSDSDVRLLTTLAGSLSVALENARLFDQTKRLLTEADERAAELAVVNSVQRGLAERLDMQAMYDLVGDKIREIFDAQVVDIATFDLATDMAAYPYTIERGVRFPNSVAPIQGISRILVKSRQPVLVNKDLPGWIADHEEPPVVIQREAPQSVLTAPLI